MICGLATKNPNELKNACPKRIEKCSYGNCIDHIVTLSSNHLLLGITITILSNQTIRVGKIRGVREKKLVTKYPEKNSTKSKK